MLSGKLYFDLKRQTPFQCIFEGKKPFSGFELLYSYESVFPLIRESISEAINRKLSNRDYKMEKILCVYISLFNLQIPSLVYINEHEYYLTPSSFLYTCSQFATFTFINIYIKIQLYKGPPVHALFASDASSGSPALYFKNEV
jgi:hypothetical protein